MAINSFKSILHNIGVTCVGFLFAFIGSRLDLLFDIAGFHAVWISALGWLLLATGFFLRVWATYIFYRHRMKVISVAPQGRLVTSGPYRFSRNPLYLGGNVFIFLGATLILGTPIGLILTAINIAAVDVMIRREEKQLNRVFGTDWIRYKSHVRRWI